MFNYFREAIEARERDKECEAKKQKDKYVHIQVN